jgi:antitoxin ParD1/3/4
MNLTLTPEWEAYVNTQVQSGRYPTVNEMICEALRLLRERDEMAQRKLEELRRAIAVGVEQAETGRLSPLNEQTLEAIKSRARR